MASGIHASGGIGRSSRNAGLSERLGAPAPAHDEPERHADADRGGEAQQHELAAVQHVLVQARVGVALHA